MHFHDSVSEVIFPECFKMAKIIPIFKSGDSNSTVSEVIFPECFKMAKIISIFKSGDSNSTVTQILQYRPVLL